MRRITFIVRAVVFSSLFVVAATSAAVAQTVVDQADYVFTGSNEPDSRIWTRFTLGTVETTFVPSVGFCMADAGNASALLFHYATAFLTGNPTDPRFANTARLTAVAQTPPVPDNSPAWTSDATGWTLIMDDGLHRTELRLARDGATKARLVRLNDAPTALPIPFGWDNELPNTYTIQRDSSGNVTVTIQSGDPADPIPHVAFYFAAQLAVSQGTASFTWGTHLDGGGTGCWQEVHAQVFSQSFPLALMLNRLQLRSGGTNEKVQVQGTIQLAANSDGVDPWNEPVTIRLSTSGGMFYEQTIQEFDLTSTGWSISAAEKTRTGIQSFMIDRTTGGYAFNLVDTKASVGVRDYSTVNASLTIGNDAGTRSVSLVENPAGSGNWSQ